LISRALVHPRFDYSLFYCWSFSRPRDHVCSIWSVNSLQRSYIHSNRTLSIKWQRLLNLTVTVTVLVFRNRPFVLINDCASFRFTNGVYGLLKDTLVMKADNMEICWCILWLVNSLFIIPIYPWTNMEKELLKCGFKGMTVQTGLFEDICQGESWWFKDRS